MGTGQTMIHSKNTSARQTGKPSLLATLLQGEILFLRKQDVFHLFPCVSPGKESSWTFGPTGTPWGPGPGCSPGVAWAKDPRGPCLTLGLRLNLSHFVHRCQRWESLVLEIRQMSWDLKAKLVPTVFVCSFGLASIQIL